MALNLARLLTCASVGALAACSADAVQVTLSEEDIRAAAAGGEVEVPFVAQFSASIDINERRAQVDALEAIAREYINVEFFEIEPGDYGTDFIIEGTIPLASVAPGSAWYIHVSELEGALEQLFTHSVQVRTGKSFSRFQEQSEGVNFMLTPDANQPIRFRFRADADGAAVLAGGFEMDGAGKMVSAIDVPPNGSISVLFKGGAYTSTGGGFLIDLGDAGELPREGAMTEEELDAALAEDVSAIVNRDATLSGSGTSANLTQTEISGLVTQIKQCWNLLPKEQASGAEVVLNMRLNQDGSLQDVPSIVSISSQPEAVMIAKKAVSAIAGCGPYSMLSANTYDQWSNINITLRP